MTTHTISDKPVFQQVADRLRQDIAAGVFRAGEAVPSIRAQATALRINPNTIKRAYDELQAEGILEHRAGLGLFVTESGAGKANTRTTQVVRAALESGIRMAVAAQIPEPDIDRAYAAAWESVRSERRAVRQEIES